MLRGKFSDFRCLGWPIHWRDVEYEARLQFPGPDRVAVLLKGRMEEMDPDALIMDPCWWKERRLFGKKAAMEHVEYIFNKNLEGLLRQ